MPYTEKEAKELVIKAGLELVEAGLIARTWGNISARISDTEFVITPSGMSYDSLTPEKIVKVKIADCSYEGDIKPSSEKGVHAEGYRLRPDCNFIVHTHQLLATAVSVTGENIPAPEEEKAVLGDYIANAEYAISSTKALKKKVSQCIEQNPKSRAILMRSHGTVCLGSSYEDAFAISKSLEKVSAAKICKELAEQGISVDTDTNTEELLQGLIRAYEEKYALSQETVSEEVIADEAISALASELGYSCICYNTDPMVRAISKRGTKVVPIIDDMAQIGGVSFSSISCKDAEKPGRLAKAMKGRSIVFIQGVGALMAGPDEDELVAIRMVLDKDLVAELYSDLRKGAKHLGFFDAKLQRTVYVKKYSKLKKD